MDESENKMTIRDKAMIEQFNKMCDSWFGIYGYSETCVMTDDNKANNYIGRVGYVTWVSPIVDVDERGFIEELFLYFEDNKIMLNVNVHTYNMFDVTKVLFAIVTVVAEYFNYEFECSDFLEKFKEDKRVVFTLHGINEV